MKLADIAPRLARARDQWNAQQRAIAEARRRREAQEVRADGRKKCRDTGKLRYRTQTSAEHALAHLLLHVPGQIPCRAYPCEFCDGWHLTSKPRRPARTTA